MTPFFLCAILWYIYHTHTHTHTHTYNSSGPYFCSPSRTPSGIYIYIYPAHHWLPQSHYRQAAWNITVHSGRSNYRHSMVSELRKLQLSTDDF